ncbi:MAG: hypothetical protein ACLFR7_12840, partial [Opitutales bacterium]
VEEAFTRMNTIYRRPVFDEWAVVDVQPEGEAILHYTGPREESIQTSLADDLCTLRTDLSRGPHEPGDFEFNRTAEGTSADAFIALGQSAYLICNHTTKTMQEITADPLWTTAQVRFLDLTQRVAADPLER